MEKSIFPQSDAYVSPDDAHSFKIKNRKDLLCSGELNSTCLPLPPGPFLGFGMPMARAYPSCQPGTGQPAQGIKHIPGDWGEPRLGEDFDLWSGPQGEPVSSTALGRLGRAVGMGMG